MKIYVHDKPLYLVSATDGELTRFRDSDELVILSAAGMMTPDEPFTTLKKEGVKGLAVVTENADTTIEEMGLVKIIASGGTVVTKDQEVLLIYRRGTWDLPKGKLDEGETLEQCALREVEEETDAKNLTLLRPLITTYHTYYEKQKHILKESHWFLMVSNDAQPLSPQTNEDIQECRWVKLEDLAPYKSNMPESIKEVLKAAEPFLSDVK